MSNSLKKQFVDRIYEEHKELYENPKVKGNLRSIRRNFPHDWLYIYEMIQNAIDVDVNATKIQIQCNEDTFILEHNGAAFEERNVESICTLAVSTKGVNTVGFMGIGFKSVFMNYERASLSSNGYRFYLEVDLQKNNWMGCVLPIWNEELLDPSAGMTTRFELSQIVPTKSPVEHMNKLWKDSRSILPMLIMKGLKQFEFNDEYWVLNKTKINSEDEIESYLLQAECMSKNKKLVWTYFQESYHPSEEAKENFITHRNFDISDEEDETEIRDELQKPRVVAVFSQLDSRSLLPLPHPGFAYAVLPTDIQLPFHFHIQADWLLITSRTQMMNFEQAWHEEIMTRVPKLFVAMFMWLLKQVESPSEATAVYGIFPYLKMDVVDEFQTWCLSQMKADLKNRLNDKPLYPTYLPSGDITYKAPRQASLLPACFNEFEQSNALNPWMLFKHPIVAKSIIPDQTLMSFSELGLLHGLQPGQIETLWDQSMISDWFSSIPAEQSAEALYILYEALGRIDQYERAADHRKLPSILNHHGEWRTPYEVKLMTEEYWTTFSQDWIQSKFLTFANKLTPYMNLDIHQKLNQYSRKSERFSKGYDRFFQGLFKYTAEELLDPLWEQTDVSDDLLIEIVRFTAFVIQYQETRRTLVKKLLAKDSTGTIVLLPAKETVLSFPYAGSHRHVIFQGIPVVWDGYMEHDPYQLGREKWRYFFERNKGDRPKGAFELTYKAEYISKWNQEVLEERTLSSFAPALRSGKLTKEWNGATITNENYTVIDADMPSAWIEAIEDPSRYQEAMEWMKEHQDWLTTKVKLVYIPSGCSHVEDRNVPAEPQWNRTLNDIAWVAVKGTEIKRKLSETLSYYDELRPDEPVANVPSDLLQALLNAGFKFGTSIPNAPALKRLEREGSRLPFSELIPLLQEAFEEANQNDDIKTKLVEVFRRVPLLPGIKGERTTVNWVVMRKGERSDLMNRVVSVQDFSDNSAERQLFELVHQMIPIPYTVDGAMALRFIEEVWEHGKEFRSDSVRSVMRSAYQYIKEEAQNNPSFYQEWIQSKSKIKVYVRGSDWVPLQDAVFNDLFHVELSVYGLKVVTPSYFGVEFEQQLEMVKFIGLSLLSNRIQTSLLVEHPTVAKTTWRDSFHSICLLIEQIIRKLFEDEDEDVVVPQDIPELWVSSNIRFIIKDLQNGTSDVKQKHAAFKDNRFYVVGDPFDFVYELVKEVLDYFGVGNKADQSGKMKNLSAQLAVAFMNLEEAERILRKLREEYNVQTTVTEEQEEGFDTMEFSEEQDLDTTTSYVSDYSTTNQPPREEVITEEVAAGTEELSLEETFEKDGDLDSLENGDAEVADTDPEWKGKASPPHIPSKPHANPTSRPKGGTFAPGAGGGPVRRPAETGGSQGYSAQRIASREKRIADLFRAHLKATGSPEEPTGSPSKMPHTDDEYRSAVEAYERKQGRFPKQMEAGQAGFDLESYDGDGQLLRRIEVKGRSTQWEGEEIVTMSVKQIETFFTQAAECWLYVVEKRSSSHYRVYPILNPARNARTYHFSATLWSLLAQNIDDVWNDDEIPIPDDLEFPEE